MIHLKAERARPGHTAVMSSTTALPFAPDTTISDMVKACPELAVFFAERRISFCCGGHVTLAEASRAHGLDPAALCAGLAAAYAAIATPAIEPDLDSLSIGSLAAHIEDHHHAYVKAELPRLVEMADRVAGKHGWRDARLPEVAATVRMLAEDMFAHMHKEESVLFPIIRKIEAGTREGFAGGAIANPIRQMEAEHESAGAAVARLRLLTDGYAPDGDACNTHRALLARLARFEADLRRHVHKENNILFPKTLAEASGEG